MQAHADNEMGTLSKEVKASLVQLAKLGTKAKLLGKEFPGSMNFVGSGPMGVHGVIELCGHYDPRVMTVCHFFLAVELLKGGGDGPCFCLRGRQVLLSKCFERTGCLVCLAVLHCFKTFPTEHVLAARGCWGLLTYL